MKAIVKTLPITLIQSLIDASKKIGVRKTKKILEKASQSEDDLIADYLIDEACKLFHIPKKDFFNNNIKGTRYAATASVAYILYNKLNFTQINISFFIKKKAKNIVTKYNIYIKNLDPCLKFDKVVLENIKLLEQKVDNYIQTVLKA